MDEKEPTQETQPKKGEPITIPLPKRDDIDKALIAITQPPSAKKHQRPKRKQG